MPAVSEAQRRFLYARFGEAWVKRHGFDNPGRLPEHAGPPALPPHRRKKRKRRH